MKRFIVIHHYVESGFMSILAFTDSFDEAESIELSHPRFGSSRHKFYICSNCGDSVQYVKDENLINICKNVAEYLSIGEYAMLKKSYLKSSAWFEKAKNSAFFASDILENY